MAAQLTVKQGDTPITVYLPSPQELGGGPGLTEIAEVATAGGLLSFVDAAVTEDSKNEQTLASLATIIKYGYLHNNYHWLASYSYWTRAKARNL